MSAHGQYVAKIDGSPPQITDRRLVTKNAMPALCYDNILMDVASLHSLTMVLSQAWSKFVAGTWKVLHVLQVASDTRDFRDDDLSSGNVTWDRLKYVNISKKTSVKQREPDGINVVFQFRTLQEKEHVQTTSFAGSPLVV